MKIALLTHHFPPRFKAGGEQYAYRVAHGLHQQGFTVEVVTIESITRGDLIPTCQTDNQFGFPVHRLSYNLHNAPNRFEWSFRHPQLGDWIKTYLEKFQPDIVHINSGYLLGGTVPEAAFSLGLPTVFTLHDYWYVCPQITLLQLNGRICIEPVPAIRCAWCQLSDKRRYRLPDQWTKGQLSDAFVWLSQSDIITRMMGLTEMEALIEDRRTYLHHVFARFNLVISPSRFLMEKMESYGLKTQRFVHLPIGLDAQHLTVATTPRRSGHLLQIGYLGQIAPHKGVHLLIEAFRRVRKRPGACKLVLYGNIAPDNSYQQKILQQVTHDPDIQLAGSYPNKEVGQILEQLDAIVVPSLWYENYPVVIVEAMATQTPVIATRLGGMAELITHNQNGLLFEVGDVANLTQQLQRLIDEPDLLSQLRAGIQPHPQLNDELKTLIGYYHELLA